MALTKKVYSKTQKIFIYGSGSLSALFLLLFSLSYLGINVETSGDQFCESECISYFNISLANYSVCFGSTFKGVYLEPKVSYELYKADMRYNRNNPDRWKPYDFSAGKCLERNKKHEFKIIGYKKPSQTVKWGLNLYGPDIDPFWYRTTQVSILEVELGTPLNLTANLTGYSGQVCVDIDHPVYGNNYSCGIPSANFILNITYFRNNQFNDSSLTKNISWVNGGNQTIYIKQHQYDEIDSASINITGFISNGTYPTSIKIYVNNSLSNSISYVYDATIIETTLRDGNITKNFTFKSSGSFTDYLYIPRTAVVSQAYLNLSGFTSISDVTKIIDAETWWNFTGTFDYSYPASYAVDENWNTMAWGLANEPAIYENTSYPYNITAINWTIKSNYNGLAPHIPKLYYWNYTGNKFQFLIYGNCKTSITSESDIFVCTVSIPVDGINNTDLSLRMKTNSTGHLRYFEGQAIFYNSSYPSGVNLDITSNGSYAFSYPGSFNQTNNRTSNFAVFINDSFSSCSPDNNDYCNVPLIFSSSTAGKLQISDIFINYTFKPNPVRLNASLIQNFLNYSSGFANIPIKFESIKNGTLTINDIRFDYAGGNKTNAVKVFPASKVWCYQEFANISTACGGLNTGLYATPALYLYINYTKPTNAIGALWQVKHGTLSAYNSTIPGSCFDYYSSTLALRIFTRDFIGSSASYGQCLNASGWNTITNTESGSVAGGSTSTPAYTYDGDWDTYAFWNSDSSAWLVEAGPIAKAKIYEESIIWDITPLNETLNITYWYSKWGFNFPRFVNYLEFIPQTPTSKNVTPYGQTSLTPIFNITTYNYGGRNANIFMYLNETHSCVDLYASQNNTKPSSSLWNGLVSYYSFDIDTRDIFGNRSNVTQVGKVFLNVSNGKQGSAYEFNVSSNYLRFGSYNTNDNYFSFNFSKNYTFVLWFKQKPTLAANLFDNGLFQIIDGTGKILIAGISIYAGKNLTVASFGGVGVFQTISSNYSIPYNSWQQIVVVYSNYSIILYHNGTKSANGTINSPISSTGLGNFLGYEDASDGNYFNGTLDEFRVYNRTLTSDEILSLYQRTSNSYFDNKLVTNWTAISWNNTYLSNNKIWLWADYSCNYTSWRLWKPDLYGRACCINCECSEVI